MSAANDAQTSTDIVRKLAIIGVLVGGVTLLHRFAVPSGDLDPRGMLAFGFVVLAAYTIGELAGVLKLPHVTGYLFAGLVLGPSMADAFSSLVPAGWALVPPFDEGILNDSVISQLSLLDDLALGLIALTAGGELKIDALRRSVRLIGGATLGHAVAVFCGVFAFMAFVGTGMVSFLSIDALTALTTPQMLAMATVVASVAMATSPPVTMAVITASGARGEMTSTVLTGVILLDVVVVLALSVFNLVATGMLGIGENASLLGPLMHIATSVVIGTALGALVHLYLKHIGAEILLFIIASVYAFTFLTERLEGETVLVFILGGFIASNFSKVGDQLIHEVERLSGPVYVVFFALAGAKLHLDVLAATILLAGGLGLVRAGSAFVGIRAGTRLAGAQPNTQRYAWMGFISQAGLALGMAGIIQRTYPGPLGDSLYSLLVAGVALNEMIGPVLLQWGLSLAGETGKATEEEPEQAEPTETPKEEAPVAWEDEHVPDPWGPPLSLQDARINGVVQDLERSLQEIVRDAAGGPFEHVREDAEDYLRTLRREFLRSHRRAVVRVQQGEQAEVLLPFLRSEIGALGQRWRDAVLDRAAWLRRREEWGPIVIVEILDELAADLPDFHGAPVEPETLVPRTERFPMRVRRALFRFRVGFLSSTREVSLRTLGQYHLAGRGPAHLEGVAALLVRADLHLASRTSALFDSIASAWLAVCAGLEEGADKERMLEMLWAIRRDLDEDFNFAVDEVDGIARDAANRLALGLGGLLRDLKRDAAMVGTLDLPYRKRRYSKVFRDRNEGLHALTVGVRGARNTAAARYAALALELELVGLEGRIRDVVEVHGNQLAKLVRGRGTTQLERVDADLTEALTRMEARIEDATITVDDLAAALRAEAEPFARVVSEAERAAASLVDRLSGEAWITPLTHALMNAAEDLTEWYTVPTARAQEGDWSLTPEVPTSEVPFRELVIGYVEASVTRDLLELTRDLEERLQRLLGVIRDLERVVAFNIELACAELDVLPDEEQLSAETRALVREMVLGAIGRSHARLKNLAAESRPWAEEARDGVMQAVMKELADLRGQVLDGRITELRLFLFRESERSRLVQRAHQWRGLVPQLRQRGVQVVEHALGVERLEAARVLLGLPEEIAWERSLHEALRPPEAAVPLPVVYRRLFSDQALEAGDLLTGRQDEVQAARDALEAQGPGQYRTAALIGPDELGVGAVLNAVARGVEYESIRRWEASAPVSVAEVESWLAASEPDELVVISGLRWFFTLEPGGFAPLRRLVEGILADGGRSRWLIGSDQCVWRYAARLVPLEEALPTVIALHPLGADELANAILSRHSMSGYSLDFRGREDLGWQLEHLFLRGRETDRAERAWFRTLHAACGGIMHDALRLWMASVEEVDEDQGILHIGRVPRPPLTRLRKLPEEIHLTLLQVLRQGWMEPRVLAELMGMELTAARARLGWMSHQGLLFHEDGRYRLALHLRRPVERVLAERGWAP